MDLKSTAGKLLQGDVKGVIDDVTQTIERTIGLSGIVIISLSSMLGSGLFVMPAFAAEMMGPGIWLAFLLAATVVLPGALSKSELASAMPSSGGSYVYLERTYGPLFGTISGLGLWASFLLKASFALIGFSAYMLALTTYFEFTLGEREITMVSVSALVLITAVNILGVKKVKAIQTPILGVTMALLAIICIMALFDGSTDFSRPINGGNGAFDQSPATIAETAAFVFVAYAGVTKVAAIGGEVKEPGRNLPMGIMLSLGIATFLYCVMTFVMMAALPDMWYIKDGTPIEDPVYQFVKAVAGSKIGVLAAALAVLTMISMALAGILAASRFLFAMARDNLLPQSLETVNAKYETPHWPIIVTGVMMLLAIMYLPVKDVAKLASGFKIMIFMLINSCVIILRRSPGAQTWYKPEYKSHFYPWIQLWGIVAGAILIYLMGSKAFIGAGTAVSVGTITYLGYGKKHSQVRTTPFQSLREKFSNPTKAQHDLRHAAFLAADFGKKNHLTLPEFINALKALGVEFTNDEFREVFHKSDADENGVIDIDEFMQTIEGIIELPSSQEE
ncbi:MAG TPA: amino acid permease [Candidatus Poseidoniaceae archaeon]|nr:MAG TPA: amino acid permease [Candidatus Poseidoniales archaeon]HII11404.1 amino acid permease [Candidatus Poseidoniaceae archaeon]